MSSCGVSWVRGCVAVRMSSCGVLGQVLGMSVCSWVNHLQMRRGSICEKEHVDALLIQ